MKRLFGKCILKLLGWRIAGIIPQDKHYVLIEAPHTSMFDFVIAKCHNYATGMQLHFIIKQEMFFFPLGQILKLLGAAPINRKHPGSLIQQMVRNFHTRDRFALAITPEGTRKKVHQWKNGFYLIASKANVPVALGFIDYRKKELGVLEMFHLTGDMAADIRAIKQKYRGITARYPDQFSLGLEEVSS